MPKWSQEPCDLSIKKQRTGNAWKHLTFTVRLVFFHIVDNIKVQTSTTGSFVNTPADLTMTHKPASQYLFRTHNATVLRNSFSGFSRIELIDRFLSFTLQSFHWLKVRRWPEIHGFIDTRLLRLLARSPNEFSRSAEGMFVSVYYLWPKIAACGLF